MFLLFDKVYVKYDFMLDNGVDNLVISPNLTPLMFDELETIHTTLGERIAHADLYEDLPYANDLEFFQTLLNKGQVNVHVDVIAYDFIFSKFIRIFFPNMPVEQVWKTYNIFRSSSQMLQTTSFIWGGAGEATQKANAEAWTPRTKEEFLDSWNNSTLDLPDSDYDAIRADAKQKIGIEWMIANRLSGDETYDVFLGEKMYKIMAGRVTSEVLFIRSALFNNMFRPWAQTVLELTNIDPSNDLLDLESVNDKTRWLFDDDDAFFTADYKAKHPNISFSSIRSQILQAVTESTTPIEEALTDEMMDFVGNNVAVQNFTTAEITSILNADKTHKGPSVFESEDRIKVNALFINYIYKLSIDNDPELSYYTL